MKKEKELRLLKDKCFATLELKCTLLRHLDELQREHIELLEKTFQEKVEEEVELRLRQIREEMRILHNQLEQNEGKENAAIAVITVVCLIFLTNTFECV